ncbi:hypothetical protein J1614_004296 [Plenodomus biglobosus]|nr:hypothetical protein J1614_004296 [Plenodomus biglobosus]
MKTFTSMSIVLLATLIGIPATDACVQRYVEYMKMKSCAEDAIIADTECRNITTTLRNYSKQHGSPYGNTITSDLKCGECGKADRVDCICTLTAWRFREWMYEPPLSERPALPTNWTMVYPENGNYGWMNTVSSRLIQLHWQGPDHCRRKRGLSNVTKHHTRSSIITSSCLVKRDAIIVESVDGAHHLWSGPNLELRILSFCSLVRIGSEWIYKLSILITIVPLATCESDL